MHFCQTASDFAVRALICEVDATPKPGLVDRENNGAHRDMDHTMFLRSAQALGPCFADCARLGYDWNRSGEPEERLADRLRAIGLDGERAMYRATGGVNTHKGLVFSLGILCTAWGMLASSPQRERDGLRNCDPQRFAHQLQAACGRLAAILLGEEKPTEAEETHGQQVRRTTGISGVKGEALSGFGTAFEEGLPRLNEALSRGSSMNDACVETLIHLLARTDDSNLVYRGGLEGLTFVRQRAKALAERYPAGALSRAEGLEEIRRLDRDCIAGNLSPGGCADVLAITVMLHFVTASFEVERKEGDI
ncbi:MAG: triphosphoribosyl-dephospho-CoA synthase [Firmicutes bacterium]|nr:triphosphoribosyl-dephospho-CoA synthase [Bacillota bacterium]